MNFISFSPKKCFLNPLRFLNLQITPPNFLKRLKILHKLFVFKYQIPLRTQHSLIHIRILSYFRNKTFIMISFLNPTFAHLWKPFLLFLLYYVFLQCFNLFYNPRGVWFVFYYFADFFLELTVFFMDVSCFFLHYLI